MHTFSVAEAKAKLSQLIELAESGQPVTITKRGRPVAQLIADLAPPPQEFPSLAEFRASLPKQKQTAADLIRKMRNADRY